MARRRHAPDETLIELFLDMLAAERGAGNNTLDAYRNDLADLTAHLRAAGKDISAADTDDLRGFLASLAERGFKASSLARRLSAVRQLYRFLYAEGKRSDDPAAVLEGPKRGRALPKVLSIAEVDSLLARARSDMEDDKQTPAVRLRAARLLCLLEVVYATGLRVSELVALPAASARRDQRMLVVRGKGGKERLVPLNQAAKRAMADYLKLRAEMERDAQSKWLFPSFGEQGHLTRQHFARELKTLGAACGIAPATPQPARAAPCLRQPSAAQRRRPSRGADVARPCRHLDHANLHPCAGRTAQGAGARPAPARRRLAKIRDKSEINPIA